MPERVTIDFTRQDLSYATGSAVNVSLDARDAALLLFVAYYLLRRDAWDDMSDADWHGLSNDIEDVIAKIKAAI